MVDGPHLNAPKSLYGPQSQQHSGNPHSQRKALVLCFDGTGNKFQGSDADSNIIKIFSMLDREDRNLFAYYQPGIGTYVEHSKLSKTGRLDRLRSWYRKTKDMAVGTSFDEHIQGGYHFLMRYYQDGDDIYFFGFSRGAYTARFLARMLDCVGLLSAGNEEMFRFAWKAFSQWETRLEDTEEQKKKKLEMWDFLRRFRETFARPIKRIRFMGLFDTVNSVPRFEAAWLQRTKFPYGARSSARVIRQACALDERRAKFRVDLVTASTQQTEAEKNAHPQRDPHLDKGIGPANTNAQPHHGHPSSGGGLSRTTTRFKGKAKRANKGNSKAVSRQPSQSSFNSVNVIQDIKASYTDDGDEADESDDDDDYQDIQEVWFPGDHGDIGGGWPLLKGTQVNVSHIPLVWMLREARKAGLPCDQEALQRACLGLDDTNPSDDHKTGPDIQLDGRPVDHRYDDEEYRNRFMDLVGQGSTTALVHDALEFGQVGISAGQVLFYRFMEWLPFRRMDLRADGKWKAIRWPLPRGEVRDLPENAVIHNTAMKRMDFDSKYRPGNLIVGGGGRGVRKAPKEYGKGMWKVLREKDHPVGEVYIRDLDATEAAISRRNTDAEKQGS